MQRVAAVHGSPGRAVGPLGCASAAPLEISRRCCVLAAIGVAAAVGADEVRAVGVHESVSKLAIEPSGHKHRRSIASQIVPPMQISPCEHEPLRIAEQNRERE